MVENEPKTNIDTSSATPSTPLLSKSEQIREFESLIGLGSSLLKEATSVSEAAGKANTATISYMDKLIILAGGTLTLTFTVIGSLSSNLHAIKLSAHCIYCVVTACWLLVLAIILSLLFNAMSINIQRRADVNVGVISLVTRLKLILVALVPNADLSEFPKVPDDAETKLLNRSRRTARYIGAAAQISIILAFILLTFFVQANLGILLNVK